MGENLTNLDWLVENERDFVVDMVSTARYCRHCAFDDVCDGFVGDIDPKCVRGNREWLLSQRANEKEGGETMTDMLDGFGYTNTQMRYTGDDSIMDAIFRDFPVKVTLMTTIDEGYADLGDLCRIFKPKRYLAMIAQPPMWSVNGGKLAQAEHYLCLPYDSVEEFQRDWSLIADIVEN